MSLVRTIDRINELFGTTEFNLLSHQEEEHLLRIAAKEFQESYLRGEIRETPPFYLESGEDGKVIVVAEGNPVGGHA